MSSIQTYLKQTQKRHLAEIVELRSIRVREIMTPRVDLLLLERGGEGREEVQRS